MLQGDQRAHFGSYPPDMAVQRCLREGMTRSSKGWPRKEFIRDARDAPRRRHRRQARNTFSPLSPSFPGGHLYRDRIERTRKVIAPLSLSLLLPAQLGQMPHMAQASEEAHMLRSRLDPLLTIEKEGEPPARAAQEEHSNCKCERGGLPMHATFAVAVPLCRQFEEV